MSAPLWLSELQTLSERFRGNGIAYDLDGMTEAELWAALTFLRRLNFEAHNESKSQ